MCELETKKFKVSLIIDVVNWVSLDIENLKDITKDSLYEVIRNEFDVNHEDIKIEDA